MSGDCIVIGAGPAGIGAALALGPRTTVIEARSGPSGLSSSVRLGHAHFDLGGHSFHTPHEKIRKLVFDALPMEEQRRDARCWFDGAIIPYPFQQHFAVLDDTAVRTACAEGLRGADDGLDAPHFEAYIGRRFGAGIGQAFLWPYNRKLWGDDLTRMETLWTRQRMVGAEQAGDTDRRTPLQAHTTVAYPKSGNFSQIYDRLASRISNILFDQEVIRIDPETRRVETGKGAVVGWRHLVSTMPLPKLLARVAGAPAALIDDVRALEALPVTLVLLAFAGQAPDSPQRLYHAGADFPGHKIVFNHQSSDWLRAQPAHGVQIEISGTQAESDAALVAQCADWLGAHGLIQHENLEETAVIRLAYGYPVPTHGHAAIVERARTWLAARDIHISGRFAEWAYINSDEALARGLALGERLSQSRA